MPRGSSPGERRGGRKRGVPNKATSDVKALAGQYSPAAIAELGRLSTKAESEAARVAAIKELLDRAYGKAAQPVVGGAEGDPPIVTRLELVAPDDDAAD